MRTDKLGPDSFRYGTQAFFAGPHACNAVRQDDTVARTFRTDLEFCLGTLTTNRSQDHQHKAQRAQAIDGPAKINLTQVLTARALMTRGTPNRMINDTHARIRDSIEFRNATVLRAWIGHLDYRQALDFFICVLSELKTR